MEPDPDDGPTRLWSPRSQGAHGFDPGVAETHVSLVVFAGDRAYKLKKPVRTPFLDFSTPDARRRACLREVELNRRLAPDVYLGVAGVLGPDGAPCDHLVVMRRMPAERRLSRLVQSGDDVTPCLERVAEALARFHAGAATGPEISAQGTRDAVAGRWESNVSEVAAYAALLPDAGSNERIARMARTYLAGREALFDHRIAEGRICDGHGDLLADDIFCLDDGPRLLDCLEFDDHLRYVDILDDAAFLAMDLERLDGPEAGRRFLDAYRRASGDAYPESLAHHYVAYRAHVRAKVACMRHEQGDEAALGTAIRLLALAEDHLSAARLALVLVGGLPGTGKTTLAVALARERGWTVLRSDEVRKELAGLAPEAPAVAAYRQGLYAPATTAATYQALLDRAEGLLALGHSVVLDASWTSAPRRDAAAELARRASADLVALRCEAPPGVAAARMVNRRRRGTDPSDATPLVAEAMAGEFDPWPEAATIDTSGDPADALRLARAPWPGCWPGKARAGRHPDSGPFGSSPTADLVAD